MGQFQPFKIQIKFKWSKDSYSRWVRDNAGYLTPWEGRLKRIESQFGRWTIDSWWNSKDLAVLSPPTLSSSAGSSTSTSSSPELSSDLLFCQSCSAATGRNLGYSQFLFVTLIYRQTNWQDDALLQYVKFFFVVFNIDVLFAIITTTLTINLLSRWEKKCWASRREHRPTSKFSGTLKGSSGLLCSSTHFCWHIAKYWTK